MWGLDGLHGFGLRGRGFGFRFRFRFGELEKKHGHVDEFERSRTRGVVVVIDVLKEEFANERNGGELLGDMFGVEAGDEFGDFEN